eukprot:3608041-Pleurochrysis_carterae.AAC.3
MESERDIGGATGRLRERGRDAMEGEKAKSGGGARKQTVERGVRTRRQGRGCRTACLVGEVSTVPRRPTGEADSAHARVIGQAFSLEIADNARGLENRRKRQCLLVVES